MAKRTRGSTRPGQRRPLQRNARPSAPPAADGRTRVRPASLTPEEEARAAELEAQLLAEERAAEDARKSARERERRSMDREPVLRPATGAAPLAIRAADEYAYVARDVRRIIIIAGGLLAIMIGLWLALQVTGTTLV